jgi:hypothetical protein
MSSLNAMERAARLGIANLDVVRKNKEDSRVYLYQLR